MRELYGFELEPEVREWLDDLSDSDFKRVDEVAGLQIDRAVRAQKICKRDHWGPVTETFERQV
ncbi:hypothetical protein [Nonomuraea sp. 10N515B]|uniref:hypothetical protein n=1 Tax=Nonomuraea sp. 10N515B TaxID=3457422 RepID=UPI003FCDC0BE